MPEATYLRIATALRDQIASSAEGFAPGDALPSESQLMQEFSVARGTARQALKRLRDEGLITIEQGRPARVRRVPPVRRMSSDRFAKAQREGGRGAYDVELRDAGYVGRTEYLALGKEKASAEVAKLLGVKTGAPVMVRSRRMFAAPLDRKGRADYDAEEVMQLATSYIPWSIANGTAITEEDSGVGGIYSRIEDAGHTLDHFHEQLAVRIGTDEEAELLGLDTPAQVLTLDRQAIDTDGQVVEICRHVMPPTFYTFEYEFRAT